MGLVSSISSMFTDYLDFEPIGNDRRKNRLLNVLDKTLIKFSNNLDNGKIKIDSVIDLERIVRCSKVIAETQQSLSNPSQPIEPNQQPVSDSVPPDDPDLESLYNKLYEKLNKANDTD